MQATHDKVLRFQNPRGINFSSPRSPTKSLLSRLVLLAKDVGQMAAAAVLAVLHGSHEDTSTASIVGALAAETLDLAVAVDLVVLEDGELGLSCACA